ncbi:hypothetical protein HDG40_005665 [Paraburkholderia sp. JPY158]|uniref:Uncharacterized protein n=1 Tax=Paraburkholderia atlantica TaxID=2654982 RepID=A0A7W8QC01_PARAM|nr:hypothetical protein [Paraburkholderia atlantica]MBB5427486.1 hypothetical protein [Paraburkholderia atlantica]
MRVRDLLSQLALADPNAEVVFLDEHADAEEADVLRVVDIRQEFWTHESGECDGRRYEAVYPCKPAERESSGYASVLAERVQVVVLSAGPTNLRYL